MSDRSKDGRTAFPHHGTVTLHDVERCTDVRGQIDFVDNQEIRLGDTGTAFSWDLVSTADVDLCRGCFQT